jgi:hypothetical protein
MNRFFKENWIYFLILFGFTLFLFFKPLFSNQPLGLDSLGHLSKVSYILKYPFADWDMSWYSGTLFLKLYSPLFYYLVAFFSLVFSNIFFVSNLICFLSLFFTVLGIYLIVDYLTKNKKISLFSGLVFLTVLSISYYWIATGNLPYFSALWTLPFSLYFLERLINEKKKGFFVLYCLTFFVGILTHILIGFLIGFLMIIRFLVKGINLKNIKKILICGMIPVLLASFWFIPFIFYSNSSESSRGYVPSIQFLFGFDECCWGLQAGGIGVVSFLFLFAFVIFLLKKLWRKQLFLFLLTSISVFAFLLFGGLGEHYPFGMDPVRVILPFSILLVLFIGLTMNEIKKQKKILFSLLLIILIFGGIWNFTVINKNFSEYSYCRDGSRYEIIQEIILDSNFPVKNEFTNYRFGTSRYVFGETINYFMPNVQHTFGYQDVGMLNISTHRDFLQTIWESEDLNKSVYYLDWFGIKYFEMNENVDFIKKFQNDSRFKLVKRFNPRGYSFVLFEYLDAKPIVSLVDNLKGVVENSTGKIKEFNVQRFHPDKIKITYDALDEGDVVLFKEFYHKNWRAKELSSGENLNIEKVGPGFMGIYPKEDSIGILIYYKNNFFDYFSIFLSILGVFLLIIFNINLFKSD